VTPELLSPVYSRFVPARLGCVLCSPVSERLRHHSLERPINLIPRRSVRPHQRPQLSQTLVGPPHGRRSASRDFVHWRFSNACCWRVWIGWSAGVRKPSQFRNMSSRYVRNFLGSYPARLLTPITSMLVVGVPVPASVITSRSHGLPLMKGRGQSASRVSSDLGEGRFRAVRGRHGTCYPQGR
jgi:hypothetical protein